MKSRKICEPSSVFARVLQKLSCECTRKGQTSSNSCRALLSNFKRRRGSPPVAPPRSETSRCLRAGRARPILVESWSRRSAFREGMI